MFRGGSGFPIRSQGRKSGELPFFKVSDMNSDGNELYMRRANNYISESQRKSLGAVRIPAGAIVFAKVGAAVFQERKRILAQDSCIDNNMAAFVVDERQLDVKFAYYLLTAFRMSDLVAVGALPSLNGAQLRSMPLIVPRDLAEQRRITSALSDADELITRIEGVVAKKQAIKQGMIQHLVTGRTRLPGFTKTWQQALLSDVAIIDPEALPASTDARALIDYISLEDVERGQILAHSHLRFGSAPSRARRVIKSGDVLFGTVRPNLKSHAIYRAGLQRPIASTGFAVVRAVRERTDAQFLFHLLMSRLTDVQVERIIAGSNYPAVSSRDIRRLAFNFPPIEEQRAIGSMLADIDDDIARITQRLVKAQAIKVGMMQQLLTGRTRLPLKGIAQ